MVDKISIPQFGGKFVSIRNYEKLEKDIANAQERERVLVYTLKIVREYLMGSSWRYVQSPDEFIRAALERKDM